MKPFLARTLLWSAIALGLLAGVWMVLDSKWSGEVERLRAKAPPSVDELLPPIDPADDAGPIYTEVGKSWARWQHVEHGSAPRHVEHFDFRRIPPEEHAPAEDPDPAFLHAPEFAQIEERMQAAGERPHCRLWNRERQEIEPETYPALAVVSQSFLLPAALHAAQGGDADVAWSRFESVLALAAHLREDPLIVALLLSHAVAKQTLDALPQVQAQAPLSADRAARLLALVRRLQPERDALRALDGERVLFAEPAWDTIVDGKMPSGIWMRAELADSLNLKLLRPWRLLDQAKYLEVEAATRASLASNPWRAAPPEEVSDFFPITRILSSGLGALTRDWILEERRARDLAEITLRLALAQAKTGFLPDTLDELGELPREPLTNAPYVYARAGAGYALALPQRAEKPAVAPRKPVRRR